MSHHTDKLAEIDSATFADTGDGRWRYEPDADETIIATFDTGDPISEGCTGVEHQIDGERSELSPKEWAQLVAFCERHGLATAKGA